MVRGQGFECNSYLIKDTTWVLVDVGTDHDVETLVKSISGQDGIEKVKKIVLTHTHFDHAGGVAEMGRLTGAEILVHPLEGNRISKGDFAVASAEMFGSTMKPFKWSPLDEDSSINTGSAIFKVLHLPGHSEGSLGLWDEKTRSLITGDTVFADGGIGRYDLPTGNYDQLKSSIERIAGMDVRDLYPGHGREILGNGSKHIAMSLQSMRSGI